MKTILNPALTLAFHLIGGPYAVSKLCGVSNTSVIRWKQNACLPRTEWTGETDYAERMEKATFGAVTKAELLAYRKPRKPRTLKVPVEAGLP